MSDCGVCLGDFEGIAEFFVKEIRLCRQLKRCGECRRPIAKNEKYQYARGKCDGEFWSQSDCLSCAEIRTGFSCHGENYGGTLWEEMRDYIFPEMNESCFDRLQTVEAKKFLR